MSLLPDALAHRAKGRRVTINLVRADARPISVLLRRRQGGDTLSGEFGAGPSGLEGPAEHRRHPEGCGRLRDRRRPGAEAAADQHRPGIAGARSISAIELAMISAESLAARLRSAEWLDADGRYRRRLSDEPPHDAPDMVLFALHSLGWAGDRAVMAARRHQPETVPPAGSSSIRTVSSRRPSIGWPTCAPSGPKAWSRCRSPGGTVRSGRASSAGPSRLPTGCATVTARQFAQFPTTIQSIAIEPDRLPGDVAPQHRDLIARAVRTWWAFGGNGEEGSGLDRGARARRRQ